MREIFIAVGMVSALGLLAGVILTVAARFFAVPTDETAEKITAVLPGANCGGCGYSGCSGYAEAVAKGLAAPNRCAVGGNAVAEEIGKILGVEVTAAERKVAALRCKGDCNATRKRFQYEGILTCTAANLVHGGDAACSFGCLGYGDCAAACEFGAITLKDGLPHPDTARCTACGQCVKACPRHLMTLRPISKTQMVACSSTEKGGPQRKVCTAGCIGCSKCTTVCETGAVTVENNLAKIDWEKCSGCGKCADICPVHCIETH